MVYTREIFFGFSHCFTCNVLSLVVVLVTSEHLQDDFCGLFVALLGYDVPCSAGDNAFDDCEFDLILPEEAR